MKKLLAFSINALLSSVTYGAQFVIVECSANSGTYAYYSEPVTGKMNRVASCGEALAKVPTSYFLLSSINGGEKTNSGVKYLFSDTPTPE